MKSMTGYGRGEAAGGGVQATVEVSSVNRKQGEITVSLPRDSEGLEPRVREEIGRWVVRGKLTARIGLVAADGFAPASLRVNAALARACARQFQALAAELNLGGGVTLETVLRVPGVIQADQDLMDVERVWPVLEKALRAALAALVKMREREGAHLGRDLAKRVGVMRRAAARIRKEAPGVVERYRTQLRERIVQAGLNAPGLDDDRVLKEVVIFADRSDISEELTRLESHFQQFADCLKSAEPVGRTLDFLAQEMHREANTIGAKANASAITREVLVLKTEVEKFREQVQNVE